jgi:type III pantothenate kinase
MSDQVEVIRAEVAPVVAQAGAVVVRTPEQYAGAAQFLKAIKAAQQKVTAHFGGMKAAAHAAWSTDDWHRELFAGSGIERVLAVTVAGPDTRSALVAAAALAGITQVDFVAASAAQSGVRNAYPQPHLLGADRWVAAIGAYHLARGACCVVDIGTAATIDAITADGQHLGGFIVPGPALMMSSLHAGTSNLAAHTAASLAGTPELFADNTRDAIERGCRIALAATLGAGRRRCFRTISASIRAA